jgi:hypothetical protein
MKQQYGLACRFSSLDIVNLDALIVQIVVFDCDTFDHFCCTFGRIADRKILCGWWRHGFGEELFRNYGNLYFLRPILKLASSLSVFFAERNP